RTESQGDQRRGGDDPRVDPPLNAQADRWLGRHPPAGVALRVLHQKGPEPAHDRPASLDDFPYRCEASTSSPQRKCWPRAYYQCSTRPGDLPALPGPEKPAGRVRVLKGHGGTLAGSRRVSGRVSRLLRALLREQVVLAALVALLVLVAVHVVSSFSALCETLLLSLRPERSGGRRERRSGLRPPYGVRGAGRCRSRFPRSVFLSSSLSGPL